MTKPFDESEALFAFEGFTSAWLSRDTSGLVEFTTEDFILWNNGSRVERTTNVALAINSWLATRMRNSRHENVRRISTPVGIVQQSLTSFESDRGSFINIPMLVVFTTRGRKVARCEEYLDSTGLSKLEWTEGTKYLP